MIRLANAADRAELLRMRRALFPNNPEEEAEVHTYLIAAHKALGYDEVERVVCFRRSLAN